jgi:hypothetical protein
MQREIPSSTESLETVKRQFELWRRQRTKRGRLPGELVERAITLAGSDNLSRIAKTLRLDYAYLKEKVEEHKKKEFLQRPSFVEIPIKTVEVEGAVCAPRRCVLEIETPGGWKARFYSPDESGVAMQESLKMFFGEGR